jgi:hypothetical protein
MRIPTLALALVGVAFLGAGGCGAGAPADPAPVEAPRTGLHHIFSTAALDGVVASDGTFDASGGSLRTGDLDGFTNGLGSRQFFSFDLTTIPAGVTVRAVEVCLQQVDQVGSPYLTHGPARFELVDYGLSLDGADFDVPALLDIGGLSANGSTFSGRCTGTTAIPLSYIAPPATRLQVRVRFESHDSDSDGVSDYVVFADSESAPSSSIFAPTMLVYWETAAN